MNLLGDALNVLMGDVLWPKVFSCRSFTHASKLLFTCDMLAGGGGTGGPVRELLYALAMMGDWGREESGLEAPWYGLGTALPVRM